ncbi:MAG TPA: hypothetical protein VK858_18620, partial [Longimicrobiales bacterium]|nr:hypothetical protein [Longimicrobiales bacterium]
VKDPKFMAVAREMSARLPDAVVREVPGSGHTVHLEAPDAWLGWVRGALSDVEPSDLRPSQ